MIAMLWIYSILLSASAFLLLYIFSSRKYNYWKKRNVQYIKPVPIFGSVLPVFGMTKTMGEWMADLCRAVDQDYFGIFVFDQPVLVVQSPKLIKAILQKDFSYFPNRSTTTPKDDVVLNNFMFFSKNQLWKNLRTTQSPVFTSGKLKLMFSHILNETNAMTDYIKTLVGIPDVESKEICAKFATNVIAKCAFAVDAKSFENHDAEFRTIGRRLFDLRFSTALRQMATWVTPTLVNIFKIRMFDEYSLSRLTDIFMDVLKVRMQSTSLKGNDLIDILLENSKNKKVSESGGEVAMVGHAVQFFVAGYETVSSTLSFTLYELCVHTDIQEKLRTEILDNIRKNNGVTYEGVADMKYLDMCVLESLRKYPVLPFLDRTCNSDYRVEGTDFVIEKGIPVYIPLFAVHYNEKYFPNPQKFDPERFSDKSKLNQDGFTYIPFGEGPRVCIGNRFGLMGVKLGLVGILSKYKLEATSRTPIPLKFTGRSTIVLQSPVGIPLKFVSI